MLRESNFVEKIIPKMKMNKKMCKKVVEIEYKNSVAIDESLVE